jgi:hypothetical protein
MSKKKIQDLTVGELIENLKHYPKDMPVRTTQGGSNNFEPISYIGEERNGYYKTKAEKTWVDVKYLVIGRLSW